MYNRRGAMGKDLLISHQEILEATKLSVEFDKSAKEYVHHNGEQPRGKEDVLCQSKTAGLFLPITHVQYSFR